MAGQIEFIDQRKEVTRRQRWNSWNLGEWWLPHRWASLLPLLGVASLLGVLIAREARDSPAVLENDPPAEVPRP